MAKMVDIDRSSASAESCTPVRDEWARATATSGAAGQVLVLACVAPMFFFGSSDYQVFPWGPPAAVVMQN
ncbi:hypothetical protein [Streptomyces sp. NPDC001970]